MFARIEANPLAIMDSKYVDCVVENMIDPSDLKYIVPVYTDYGSSFTVTTSREQWNEMVPNIEFPSTTDDLLTDDQANANILGFRFNKYSLWVAASVRDEKERSDTKQAPGKKRTASDATPPPRE